MNTVRHAALVLRRSTNRQDASIEDQRRECVEYCSRQAIEVLREYVDDAVSGDDAERRVGLKQLIADARSPQHAFNTVVAYDSSRFGRAEILETSALVQSLRVCGIEILFVKENIPLDDDFGQIAFAALQLKNHALVKQISQDTLRGMTSRAMAGFWCGGPPPYGYDLLLVNRETGIARCRIRLIRQARRGTQRHNGLRLGSIHDELTPDGKFIRRLEGSTVNYASVKLENEVSRLVPGEAARVEVVRRIFELAANGGLGLKRIARILNVESAPPPSGIGPWKLNAVKSVVSNPVYKGTFRWNVRAEGKYHKLVNGRAEKRARLEKSEVRRNEEASWFVKQIPELAMVDESLWQAAQREVARRSAKHYRPPQEGSHFARYPLGGLIFCKNCGGKMFGATFKREQETKSGPKLYSYGKYVCSTHLQVGPEACLNGTVEKERIEQFILSKIRGIIQPIIESQALREAIRRQLAESYGQVSRALPAKPERQSEVERKLVALAKLTSEERRLMGLEASFQELARRREELKAEPASPSPALDLDKAVEEVVGCFSELEGVESLPRDAQRALYGKFVDRITLRFEAQKNGERTRAVLQDGTLELWTLPRAAVEKFLTPVQSAPPLCSDRENSSTAVRGSVQSLRVPPVSSALRRSPFSL